MRQETMTTDSGNNGMANHGLHIVNNILIATAPDGFADNAFLLFKRALLAKVHGGAMRQVVIDVSPVVFLDSTTFEMLSSTAKMLNLLGARVIFSGFQPGVVAALIELEADFGCFATALNLADAMNLFAQTTTMQDQKPEEQPAATDTSLQAEPLAPEGSANVC